MRLTQDPIQVGHFFILVITIKFSIKVQLTATILQLRKIHRLNHTFSVYVKKDLYILNFILRMTAELIDHLKPVTKIQ